MGTRDPKIGDVVVVGGGLRVSDVPPYWIRSWQEPLLVEIDELRAEGDRLRAAIEDVIEVDETGDRCWLNPDLTPAKIAARLRDALDAKDGSA